MKVTVQTSSQTAALRADLYHALAEALAEPPDWLALAGRQWPLLTIALRLADTSVVAGRAVAALADVPGESLPGRRARYAALFAGPGRPRFWLYESAHRQGRLLGEASLTVRRLYQAAGLEVADAELPDHAAVELAFLAHLAGQQAREPERGAAWRQLERRFIKKHAGCWLPGLGRALAGSGDAVYAPIGWLLAHWLEEEGRGSRGAVEQGTPRYLPLIAREANCTLCGFCVQACPTRALAIGETSDETALLLFAANCVSCGKCERFCETGALRLVPGNGAPASWLALRRSPRAICPACGRPTVSCAELDFVAGQIGRPDWLAYCLECRPYKKRLKAEG